jgi:tRNA threonylcarbamoyladenosine biosynthesis protein TsaB
MNFLAVDTASRSCSVAVGGGRQPAVELTAAAGRTHATHLMNMICAVLNLAELDWLQLDGFGVTIGPGSFTGLRIGVSTIKGLVFATGKPVCGISSLDILAHQALPWPFDICPMLDARKGEVYAGLYRWRDGRLQHVAAERVLPPEEALRDIHDPCLFIGDGAQLYRDRITEHMGGKAHIAPPERNFIHAASLARLAVVRYENHGGDDLDSLAPRYVRQSDAKEPLPAKVSLS